MGIVAVHAAVRQETDQVKGGALGSRFIHRPDQGLLFKEVAIPDVLGDAGQLLIHHAASAQVQVADLAVAHLPVGQADRHAAGAQLRMGIGGLQAVHIGGARRDHGVSDGVGVDAKPVHDDQRRHFL